VKTISIFNNKGGVGKTTLTFHLAHALAAMGHKTLIIDFDPQCNLTIIGMDEETLYKIWREEDSFVEDFERARNKVSQVDFDALTGSVRSIHFLLKPTEDGTAELKTLSPPYSLASNLDLIPGRLTMHLYEDKISKLWSEIYQGEPQAIRTITKIRDIAHAYAKQHGYQFVIMDTSPSLGALNKVIISTTDGFLIPCMPDMFSLYGIRNIGNALAIWKKQFDTIYQLLSAEKRRSFPEKFVRLLGFTIYNAKLYTREGAKYWNLATAHYNYAMQVPQAIRDFIQPEIRQDIDDVTMSHPVGEMAIMHSHNTFPSLAQKYHVPIWNVPSVVSLEDIDRNTVGGNRAKFEVTESKYIEFATDLLARIKKLD
jgi:cellulose biosynthesis protein BcsQ